MLFVSEPDLRQLRVPIVRQHTHCCVCEPDDLLTATRLFSLQKQARHHAAERHAATMKATHTSVQHQTETEVHGHYHFILVSTPSKLGPLYTANCRFPLCVDLPTAGMVTTGDR